MKQRPLLVLFGGGAALALLALLALHLYPGDPLYYYSDPLKARVIDETTGKPVEGAVVIAVWVMESRYIHPIDKYLFKAEAVTDANGEFVIPALPRTWRPLAYGLDTRDPELLVYKPGYAAGYFDNRAEYVGPGAGMPRPRHNTVLPDGRVLMVKMNRWGLAKRRAFWNGRSLALQRAPSLEAEGAAYEYVESHAVNVGLHPESFPITWNALVVGYNKLPPNAAQGRINPQEVIDWVKVHPHENF